MNPRILRPLPAVLIAILAASPASRAGEGDGRVSTAHVAGLGRPVVARTDAGGGIHLLGDSAEGPMYAKSIDGGKTFGPAIRVIDGAPRVPGLEYSAWDLAVGKGGRVHVAMGTNAWRLKLPEEEWGFYHASLAPGASRFSPARNINRKPSEGFSLAADGEGRVTACWLSGRLYANVSRDDGETFAPAVELDARLDPCNCCTTSAVYGEDGRLAFLYREETGDERDMHLVLWDQESGMTSRTRVGLTPWKVNACPMTYFSIARDKVGYAAAWPTRGRVYFARLDGEGKPATPAEVRTPGTSGMRTGVLALTAPDGATLVAWKDKDAPGGRIGWQLYGANGEPLGPPGSAEGPGAGAAGVAVEGGRFLLFR